MMRRVLDRLGGLAFGGDYNPEQWPREVWEQDVALMRQARVNLVTLGVFSWALLEPEEGSYEFGWFDEVLDLLHAAGIAVDLATATASPPPWFTHRHPSARLVDADGVVRQHGARQAFCPSSPDYRVAAARLARTLADRYGAHPAVVMWHVNNEYGCHNWQCFCQTSAIAFRLWLERRYGTLEKLNAAWGTAFWSQHYSAWDHIVPPGAVSYNSFANPTSQLDWSRFCSDELLECFRAEAQELRSRTRQPVTTNFMSFFKPVDYFSWAPDMDIISNDDYLITDNENPAQLTAMSADLMRALSPDGQWLLMEHSTSAVNWQQRNPAKAPGQMRRNSLQHIARGSAGAMYFQWRAARAGAEKFHSAMLPHAGVDTARWREVAALGADVAKLGVLARSTPPAARVAILFDWNSWWAAELDSHPSADFSVFGQVQRWHRELWSRNVGVNFVHPNGDLAGYSVVLLPALYLMDDDAAACVAEFVASGGTLLAGYFSGIVDENEHIRLGGYPGAIKDVLGITVEEFDPLPAGVRIRLSRFGSGTIWSETAVAGLADVLAEYSDGNARGSVAVSHHRFGTGHALYLGTELEDAGLSEVFDEVLRFGAVDVDPAYTGVDIVQRFGPAHQYSFVINHSGEAVTVPIPGKDLLTGTTWPDSTLVPAGEVVVLEAQRTN